MDSSSAQDRLRSAQNMSDATESDTGSSRLPTGSISKELSIKITTVSFFAACAVVLIHAHPSELEFLGAEYRIDKILCEFFSRQITHFSVPLFFVISGYLFAVKSNLGKQPHWYSTTLKKRFRTLLIPYLIWCTIYAFTYLPFKILGNVLAERDLLFCLETNLKYPVFSVWNIGRIYGLDIFLFPMAISMWYVRDLLLLFLISPIFFPLFKNKIIANLYLLFAFVLIFFQNEFPYWNLEYGFSLRGLFFFPLGIYLAFYPVGHNRFQVIRKMLPAFWIGAAVMEAYFSTRSAFLEHFFKTINSLFGVGAVWVLVDFFPGLLNLGRKKYAKDTFFLYTIHKDILAFLFCNIIEKIFIYKFHIPVTGLLLFSAFVALVLSLVIADLLKRFIPRAYRILTGGR